MQDNIPTGDDDERNNDEDGKNDNEQEGEEVSGKDMSLSNIPSNLNIYGDIISPTILWLSLDDDMTEQEIQSTWFSAQEMQQARQQQQQQDRAEAWERQAQRQCVWRAVLGLQAQLENVNDAAEQLRQTSLAVTAVSAQQAAARASQDRCDVMSLLCYDQQQQEEEFSLSEKPPLSLFRTTRRIMSCLAYQGVFLSR